MSARKCRLAYCPAGNGRITVEVSIGCTWQSADLPPWEVLCKICIKPSLGNFPSQVKSNVCHKNLSPHRHTRCQSSESPAHNNRPSHPPPQGSRISYDLDTSSIKTSNKPVTHVSTQASKSTDTQPIVGEGLYSTTLKPNIVHTLHFKTQSGLIVGGHFIGLNHHRSPDLKVPATSRTFQDNAA